MLLSVAIRNVRSLLIAFLGHLDAVDNFQPWVILSWFVLIDIIFIIGIDLDDPAAVPSDRAGFHQLVEIVLQEHGEE